MKKLNTTTYKYATTVSSYSQYKVIETNEGFFLNTVYHHNKEIFEPTTKQSYNDSFASTIPQNTMILDRHTLPGSYHYGYVETNSCIPDLYTPNIYYISSESFLGKYEEKDGVINEILKSYRSANEECFYHYLGQNEEFLFFAKFYHSSKVIIKVSKSTLVASSMLIYYSYSSYIYRPTVIAETTDNIYFFYFSTRNTSSASPYMSIGKIDKQKSSCTQIAELTSFSIVSNSNSYTPNVVTDTIINISEKIYGIIVRNPINTMNASDCFYFIQLDLTDEENPVNTVTKLPVSNFTVPTYNYYHCRCKYYIFNNTINGTEYLYFIRSYYNAASTDYKNTPDCTYFCMYTFKIIKDSNGIPTELSQIEYHENSIIDSDIKTYLITKDKKMIVFLTKKGLYITKLDETTGLFSLIKTLEATNILTFGIDALNRIWIMYTDYSVDFIGLTDFSSYVIEFEKDDYAYNGEDVQTYIKLKCLDILENRVDGSFNLTIVGNAIFDANKTKTLTVATTSSDEEDLKVPIVINGAGRIVVYPTLVV